MMPRSAQPAPVVSLFAWPDLVALEAMERERQALRAQIDTLPRFSHRRIVLAARLQDLTHRSIAAQVDLRRRRP